MPKAKFILLFNPETMRDASFCFYSTVFLVSPRFLFPLCVSRTCSQVEDLKAKLALQEVELHHRNSDTEALIAKIGQQTDKLNQEKSVADAEEQRVRHIRSRNKVCISGRLSNTFACMCR